MTEETKKLFDAPWKSTERDFVVDCNGHAFTQTETREQANRLARLPELYDALWESAKAYCKDASFNCLSKRHRCMVLMDHMKCDAIPWIELLKRVKDGE